jgi:poly(A) polymerase
MNQKNIRTNLAKKLPAEVKNLFEVFGGEIRLVGGSVRDLLLEKKVSDFDFATKFTPEEITKILEKNKIKAVPTGVKFGTITAVLNRKNFEITTLRKDSETDGRHCKPEFVSDYKLDAARRDFTINALYLDAEGFVHDYFDGISDLKNQKVRFIGNANLRIEEDFLRVLRFFRFSCQYAEELDFVGLEACVKQKKNLKKLSKERVRAEILKMLGSDKKENLIAVLRVLKSKEIAKEIFAESLDFESLEKLFEIEKEFQISANLNLKIATVFLNEGIDLKKFATEICATNLEKKYFSFLRGGGFVSKNLLVNSEREPLTPALSHKGRGGQLEFTATPFFIVKEVFFELAATPSPLVGEGWGEGYLPTKTQLNYLLAFFDKELVLDLYLLTLAKNFDPKKLPKAKKNFQFLQNFSLPKFPLNGEDVISIGFKEKAAGMAIKSAKKFWAENNFKPKKPDLIKFLQSKK